MLMVKLLSNEKDIKTRSRNKQNFNYDNLKIVCLQIFFIIIFLLLLLFYYYYFNIIYF